MTRPGGYRRRWAFLAIVATSALSALCGAGTVAASAPRAVSGCSTVMHVEGEAPKVFTAYTVHIAVHPAQKDASGRPWNPSAKELSGLADRLEREANASLNQAALPQGDLGRNAVVFEVHIAPAMSSSDVRGAFDVRIAPGNARSTELSWFLDAPEQDYVLPHEIGHLLGLDDMYVEFLADASGRQVVVPRGTVSQSSPGRILDPAVARRLAEQYGLDAATLLVGTRDLPGHETDIMASSKPGAAGGFTEEALRQIARRHLGGDCVGGRDRKRPDPARSCYREHFVPFDEVASSDDAVGWYGTPRAGRRVRLSIACRLADERHQVEGLVRLFGGLRRDARVAHDLCSVAVDKRVCEPWDRQAALNRGALAGEIAMRVARVTTLIGLRKPGYRPRVAALRDWRLTERRVVTDVMRAGV